MRLHQIAKSVLTTAELFLESNQSTRMRFAWGSCSFVEFAKYSSLPVGSALIVFEPSLQFAGHTSPYLSYSAHMSNSIDMCNEVNTHSELERLDEAQGLVHTPADGKIVDGNLAEDTLRVDDEQPAERNPLILNEDTVVARDLQVPVREQWELEVRAEPALLARLRSPGKVREVRVGGDGCV